MHSGALGGPKPAPMEAQLNSSNNMRQFMPKNTLPMSKFHNKILIPSSGSSGQPGAPIAPAILGATPNFQSSQNHQDNYQIGPGAPPSQASMIHSIGGHWQKARHQQFRVAMNHTQIMPENGARILSLTQNSNDGLT